MGTSDFPTEGQSEASTALPSANRRYGAFAWCGISGCISVLLLPIVVALVLYGCEYSRCTEFVATGDPLFDRYAKALVEEHAWRFYVTKEGVPYPTTLPYKTLAGWEPDFGDDPRYWELVWRCTQDLEKHFDEIAPGASVNNRIELAKYLVAQDKATPELAYELWISERRNWRDELSDELDAVEDTQPYWIASYAREKVLCQAKLDEMLALLDDVVGADPERSYSYYRRAQVYIACGDRDKAVADLIEGNVAADNRWRAPFPESSAAAAYVKGELAGNAAISGLLATNLMAVDLDNFGLIRSITEEACVSTGMRSDRTLLDEWFKFLCRYGAMDDADWLPRSMAAICVRRLCEFYLVEYGSELTPEQRRDLLKLFDTANKVPSEISKLVAEREGVSMKRSDNAFSIAHLLPWDNSADFRHISSHFSFDYNETKRFQSIFERCAKFSFETMRFPDEPTPD